MFFSFSLLILFTGRHDNGRRGYANSNISFSF
ncbi:MAG: hypothetical protein [Bacteriophage sp.]|nr:MAG: hypothetical protein [Bacteriophage sp.]